MSEVRKSIVFSARMDTSEMSTAVENIKRQFADLDRFQSRGQMAARMSQQGTGGILSVPKPEDLRRHKNDLLQFIREQNQGEQNLYKMKLQQEAKINAMKKEGAKFDADSLKTAQERLRAIEQAHSKVQKNLESAVDLSAGKPNPPGGMNANSLKKAAQALGIPLTIAAIAAVAGKAITQYAGLPREITTATGAATQGLVGNQLQGLQSGDIVKSMAFRKEWGESLNEAAKERKIANFLGAARLGSVNGMIGRFGGDASDIMNMALPGLGSATIGRLTKPFETAYQSSQMQRQMEDAQANYAAKMENDPKKVAAVNMFQQNFMRDLQAQRMMGLSDAGYFGPGGFQERANKSFNPELALGMSAQIQGAGGSTRGIRDLSVLGLQAQRGFDLTNAGGVLGRISGTAGDTKNSEQIFKKLMEESIKAGLDKSDFAEEQRRFTDVTSEILANSGVKNSQDAAQVLAGFTKFLGNGDQTVKGIEGARGAYEQAQGISAQTGGRVGALKMAAFMQNRNLRSLGAGGLGALSEMPEKDLLASNPDVITASIKAGFKTPQDLVDVLKSGDRNAMLISLGLNPSEVDEFGKSAEGRAFNPNDEGSVRGLSKSHLNTWYKIQSQAPFLFNYKSPQEKLAAEKGILGIGANGPMEGFGGNAGGPDYDAYLNKISGGSRMGDQTVAASGQVSQEFLENFREFSKAMTPSTDAVLEWTKQLMMSAAVLRFTAEGDKASAQKALSDAMAKSASRGNQPTVSKRSP